MFKNPRNFFSFILLIIMVIMFLMVPLAAAKAISLQEVAGTWPDFPAIWALIYPRLIILMALTVLDFLFGVILSLIAKEFKWDYLLHYLNTDLLPILSWMAIAVISTIPAEFFPKGMLPVIEYGVYATVFLAIIGSLYGHFQKIGVLSAGGIKEPPQ